MEDELSLEEVQSLIVEECDGIRDLLIDKNKKYGNSAINPKRIFSKCNTTEQIRVRIDDKLSRISNMKFSTDNDEETEDACKDLIGYLILLRVASKVENKST